MSSNTPSLSRDDLADRYLEQLQFEPYPLQEEALLAWFSAKQGVLVCAPTGTGKTLIAEAALFEALHSGQTAYYTTPLIALTEQKFREMQTAAVGWGFEPTDVGLVTGNRRENPDARILVVVAEILFNRLLHHEAFDFADVSTVVMDEFHSFADYHRGIVWEFSLGLLPPHVRTLLLSATVGNAVEFVGWLRTKHNRRLELVRGNERKVPLTFHWVPDRLLSEQIEEMAAGDLDGRRTPALVFCFNREQCWSVAEQIKGKRVVTSEQQKALAEELKKYDFTEGAGPKLRQILQRGVGVHHAGVLPKYRRIVEELFQRKMLSIATCTETLAAGINLPARSVVVPEILKGPPDKKRLLDASTAHQIFGRAGRPQFDDQGYVYVMAHEDDVKIARWREQYDQIPEDTKDPNLRKAKKRLKKKMPKRRTNQQYWNEAQFDKLCAAEPGKLYSRAPLPWRLLAYMLDASPEVEIVRQLVGKRLADSDRGLEAGQRALDKMLLTLWRAGYVTLDPEPPKNDEPIEQSVAKPKPKPKTLGLLELALSGKDPAESEQPEPPPYRPEFAHPTVELPKMLLLRGINPLYGLFLMNYLGIADRAERIQALESVLELSGSVARHVRVPPQDQLPPGPLATTRLDEQLLRQGLATAEQLAQQPREDFDHRNTFDEPPVWVLTLAEKLRLQFEFDFPEVDDVRIIPAWVAGELLEFGGKFNNFISSKQLQKQEGVVFRHLLRLILLLGEMTQLCPPDTTEESWRGDLEEIATVLAESCRAIDPASTDKALEQAAAVDDLGVNATRK